MWVDRNIIFNDAVLLFEGNFVGLFDLQNSSMKYFINYLQNIHIVINCFCLIEIAAAEKNGAII